MPKKRGRKTNPQKVNNRLIIVCEGEKTEFNYFDEYLRRFKFYGRQVAIKVVNVKLNTARELVKFLRNMREDDDDELWAVFDKDGYTKHPDAFKMAKDNNIKIAFSSIAFEFWILLHFEYTTRAFERAEEVIGYIRNKGYIDYKKNDRTTYKKIKSKTATACTHARRVRKYQDEANSNTKIYDLNPYTNVDELLEAIEKMSEVVNGI